MEKKPRRGDIVELAVTGLVYGGRGIARTDDFVWFVEKALPGQTVKARVIKRKKNFGEAYTVEVISPSQHEVEAPCVVFGTCGGCKLQNFAYKEQVKAKVGQVEDLVRRVGGLDEFKLLPAIPAVDIYYYRNKMEFSFGDFPWLIEGREDRPTEFALGLHVPRRFDRVLDLDACIIQSKRAGLIFNTIRQLTLDSGLPPYHLRDHHGFWRFLVMREGINTGDILVNLITSSQLGEKGQLAVDNINDILLEKHPEITTLIHGISDKVAQVAFTDSERILKGNGKITEIISGKKFEISPNAFFQTNSLQTEKLFQVIADLGDFKGTEVLYDLYCGTGAIGIFLADRVKNVLGIEVIEEAVKDARQNAKLNNLDNIEFIMADMKDAITNKEELTRIFGAPDVVILDPPRGGTHPKTVKNLLEMAAPRIIYVSCNPSILARDLDILCENMYELKSLQPVDMFPHTAHIETVALLALSPTDC